MITNAVASGRTGRKQILTSRNRRRATSLRAAAAALLMWAGLPAHAQCPITELTSELRPPIGSAQSSLGNLLIAENGPQAPNTGRISIVGLDGRRRTLLDGLPSGVSAVGEPSGPTGLFLRGRTLFVAIGEGNAALSGGTPGTAVLNPNPSSPIFSSILAIHFSASIEMNTEGLALTLADQHALAHGDKVILSNGTGDRIMIEMVADFPNHIPFPLPTFPANVQLSNPFDLVVVGEQLYVTDGGRNHVWQVNLLTRAVTVLASFPSIPNPMFPAVGGPTSQAVPTGIRYADGQLLVTLFRGVPFAPGTSVVEQIDLLTGAHAPLLAGLKTAIDVLPISSVNGTDYLVLQHASVGPFFGGPGLLLRFPAAGGPPSIIANCLDHPTSMTLDDKTGTVYVTELLTGRLVAVALQP